MPEIPPDNVSDTGKDIKPYTIAEIAELKAASKLKLPINIDKPELVQPGEDQENRINSLEKCIRKLERQKAVYIQQEEYPENECCRLTLRWPKASTPVQGPVDVAKFFEEKEIPEGGAQISTKSEAVTKKSTCGLQ